MAKKKSQDDYTKFSLPQPHHPSTQPKANDDIEVSEMPSSQEAKSQREAQSQAAQSEQASPKQAQSEESSLPGLDPN